MKNIFVFFLLIITIGLQAQPWNRDRVQDSIQNLQAREPISTEDLQSVLDTAFLQSVVMRVDVSYSQTGTGATDTINFTNYDYVSYNLEGDVSLTITGLNQGEVKYLNIHSKPIGSRTVTFANATDVSVSRKYIENEDPSLYAVINKDGTNIFVKPISKDVGTAGEVYKGVVELATSTQAKDMVCDSCVITAEHLGTVLNQVMTKQVDIGNWNMNSNAFTNVAHGLTFTKILGVVATVRNDANTTYYNFLYNGETNKISWNTTNVVLERQTSGSFDSASFETPPSSNRGWVLIYYIN